MLSFLVGGASAVATRDPLSLQLLRRIVPSGPRMTMVGDDALGLRCDRRPGRSRPASRRSVCRSIVPYWDSRRERPPTLGSLATSSRILPGKSTISRRKTATSSSPCRSTCSPHGPEVELLADLAHGSRRRAQWHIVNPAGDVAAIAGVIKVCSAVLTHSYHAAIFALENRIPTLLFARTEYYQLKAEALRGRVRDTGSARAHARIWRMARSPNSSRRSRSHPGREAMTSADVDAWLDGALPREGSRVGTTSIAMFDRAKLAIAG